MVKYEYRSKTSKPFVCFWESVTNKEGAKGRTDYVLKPINEYNMQAKKILELGCGIGLVLANLPKRFDIYGLDIEEDYIAVCKEKIPRGTFFVASMHNFKIDEKFDVIFSADDALNFLKDFDQWKSTFQTVNEHLNRNGLFIFDVYTPKELKVALKWLKKYKRFTSSVREFSKGYYYDKELIKDNTLTWDARIFERLPNGLYQLNKYRFKETIYPVAKVKSALSKHFEILEANLREEGRKILFVCRKK
jgi:SAM-dependent methyltransferase